VAVRIDGAVHQCDVILEPLDLLLEGMDEPEAHGEDAREPHPGVLLVFRQFAATLTNTERLQGIHRLGCGSAVQGIGELVAQRVSFSIPPHIGLSLSSSDMERAIAILWAKVSRAFSRCSG